MDVSVNPFVNDPVYNIKIIHHSFIDKNDYNPNHVLSKEMALLEHSILTNGVIQPILVNKSENSRYVIIDGFHRCSLFKNSKKILKRYRGFVPCCVLELGPIEVRLLTIRVNAAKGSHIVVKLGSVVNELLDLGATKKDILEGIGLSEKELKILVNKDIFKLRKVAEHKYSQAWIPQKEKRVKIKNGPKNI